jgi:hypothetical protein
MRDGVLCGADIQLIFKVKVGLLFMIIFRRLAATADHLAQTKQTTHEEASRLKAFFLLFAAGLNLLLTLDRQGTGANKMPPHWPTKPSILARSPKQVFLARLF